MRQMMVEVAKLNGNPPKMMAQGSRKRQSRALERLMLQGLHVIDFPCGKTCREFPSPILKNASRREPAHALGQILIPGSSSLPVAGDYNPVGITGILQEQLGEREGIIRFHIDAALVLERTFQCFGKKHAPRPIDQRDGRIMIRGT